MQTLARSLLTVGISVWLLLIPYRVVAVDLAPRRELLCAALLTDPIFANPDTRHLANFTDPGFLLDRDPIALDQHALAVDETLRQWRADGRDFSAIEFSRRVFGRETIAKFWASVRDRAFQLEKSLQDQGALSKRFWTLERLMDVGLQAMLPAMFAVVDGWSVISVTISPPEQHWLAPTVYGVNLCMLAGGALMCRENLKALKTYAKAMFDRGLRNEIANEDPERVGDVATFMNVLPAKDLAFRFSERGSTMIGIFSEDVAKLLLVPPNERAVAVEIENYHQLLSDALEGLSRKDAGWKDKGLRLFRVRLRAFDDVVTGERCLEIEVSLFKPTYPQGRNRPDDSKEFGTNPDRWLGGFVPQGLSFVP